MVDMGCVVEWSTYMFVSNMKFLATSAAFWHFSKLLSEMVKCCLGHGYDLSHTPHLSAKKEYVPAKTYKIYSFCGSEALFKYDFSDRYAMQMFLSFSASVLPKSLSCRKSSYKSSLKVTITLFTISHISLLLDYYSNIAR
jgi:hypothetical protein